MRSTADALARAAGAVRRHPVAAAAVAGIAIHLLMMCLTVNYDNGYWALVIRNIEAGEGLYGVDGYYYTPPWGYVLGLVSALQSALLDIGETVVRVPELLPVEGFDWFYLSATVPSLEFVWSLKLVLLASDLAMAWAVHAIVMDRSGDPRRAASAFALTFLCPALLGASCVVAMPDTLAVMCMTLSILLLAKGHPAAAGSVFCLAAMFKFFPVFILPVLVGYVLRTASDRRDAAAKVALAGAAFALTALVLFLPQIASGSLEQCFRFLTDRTGDSAEDGILEFIAGKARIAVYLAAGALSLWLGRRAARGADPGRDLLLYPLILMAVCMLYPPAPQYLVVLVPLLACWIALEDRGLLRGWALVSAGAISFSLLANSMLTASLAFGGGPVPPELALSVAHFYLDGGAPVLWAFYLASGIVQYLGVLAVALRLSGAQRGGSAAS